MFKGNFTAILDACVLYPAPLRDFLLRLSEVELYRARWTKEIENEWVTNLLKNRADLERKKLERTCELMRKAIADSEVTGHISLVDSLDLPDEGDRHVLAAAIVGRADVIVTFNLKDYPKEKLSL
jgi:predicted nucleic acid-binding protein